MVSQSELVQALSEATDALDFATVALGKERRTRRVQVWALLACILLTLGLVIVAYHNSRKISLSNCESINASREDMRLVLDTLADSPLGGDSPGAAQFEILLHDISDELLVPETC